MKNKKLLLGIGLGVATLGAIYLFNKKKEKEEKNLNFGGVGILMERKKKQDLLEQESSKESLGEMIVDLVKAAKYNGSDKISAWFIYQKTFNNIMLKSGYGEISGDILSMVNSYRNRDNWSTKQMEVSFNKLGYGKDVFRLITDYISDSFNGSILMSNKAATSFIKNLKDLGY